MTPESFDEQYSTILRHVGLLTLRTAAIDQSLSLLFSSWQGHTSPESAITSILDKTTSTKVKHLRQALPESWPDREPLLTHITNVADYRNTLSHSEIMAWSVAPNPQVSWRTRRERTGMKPEMLDLHAFPSWEMRAFGVYLIFIAALTTPHTVLVTWMDHRQHSWRRDTPPPENTTGASRGRLTPAPFVSDGGAV